MRGSIDLHQFHQYSYCIGLAQCQASKGKITHDPYPIQKDNMIPRMVANW
jgi:hypothetical protein